MAKITELLDGGNIVSTDVIEIARPSLGLAGSKKITGANAAVGLLAIAGLATTGITGALTFAKAGTTVRTATFPDASIVVAGKDIDNGWTVAQTFYTTNFTLAPAAGGAFVDINPTTTAAASSYLQLRRNTTGSARIWRIGMGITLSDALEFYDSTGSALRASLTTAGTFSAASLTATGLTSGRVAITSTGGLLATDAALTYSAAVLVLGDGTGAPLLRINGAAGQTRGIMLRTNSSNRFYYYIDNTAESGANAGSNFGISAYDDAGTFIDSPISIIRAAGSAITLARPTTIGYASAQFIVGNGSGAPRVIIDGAATNARLVNIRTAGSTRWQFGGDATAESGSNAGSAFILSAYTDAAGLIDSPITIVRAAGGLITLARPVTITPGTGTVTISQNSAVIGLQIRQSSAGINSPALEFYSGSGYRHQIREVDGAAGYLSFISVDGTTYQFDQNVNVTKAINGSITSRVTNTTVGTAAQANFQVYNDAGTLCASMIALSTGYTTAGILTPGSGGLFSASSAGLFICSSNASGTLRFSAGGTTEAARFNVAGNLLIGTTTDSMAANGSLRVAKEAVIGDNTGAPTLSISGAAANNRTFNFSTGVTGRWSIICNSTTESGSDAGSNLDIVARTDAGAIIDTPISFARVAAGQITIRRQTTLDFAGAVFTVGNGGSAGTPIMQLTAAAASPADVRFLTNGSRRWVFQKSSGAESGSNAGSDFALHSYSDTNTLIDTPLIINRAAGTGIFLARPTTINYSSAILTIGDGTGSPAININGAAGGLRQLSFNSAASSRWIFKVDNTAEAGSNAGSDFSILARSDAGTAIDTPLTIVRAAGGAITLARPTICGADPGGSEQLRVGGNIRANGTDYNLGAGGTGNSNATITLNGSNASSYGAQLRFQRSAVLKGSIGNNSAIFGGASDDITISSVSGVQIRLNVNGTDRLIATASGVDITGATSVLVTGSGATNTIISRNNQAAAATVGSYLLFQGVGATSQGAVLAAWDGAATTAAYLSLWSVTSSTLTERARITSGGSLLVGSTTDGMTAGGSLRVAKDLVTEGKRVFKLRSVTSAASTTALDATDHAVNVTGSTTHTLTLDACASGRVIVIKNSSTGTVTVNRAGSDTIDGGTTFNLTTGQSAYLLGNGTNYVRLI